MKHYKVKMIFKHRLSQQIGPTAAQILSAQASFGNKLVLNMSFD